MKHLTDSIELSLKTENWYSAISVALMLPDICCKATDGEKTNGKKYAQWFNEFVGEYYRTSYSEARLAQVEQHAPEIFEKIRHQTKLSGNDCYALRCAFLHEGSGEITHQNARNILDRIVFIKPNSKMVIHGMITNEGLKLHIDIFCEDIVSGVENWKSKLDKMQLARLQSLLLVENVFDSMNK